MGNTSIILEPDNAYPDPTTPPLFVCPAAPVRGWSFAITGTQRIYYRLVAAQYGSGPMTALINAYSSATSGSFAVEAAIAAAQPAQSMEALDYDTAQVTVTVVNTTAKARNAVSIVIPTIDSLVVNAEFYLRISRLPLEVADDMSAALIHTSGLLSYSNV